MGSSSDDEQKKPEKVDKQTWYKPRLATWITAEHWREVGSMSCDANMHFFVDLLSHSVLLLQTPLGSSCVWEQVELFGDLRGGFSLICLKESSSNS